MAKKTFAVSGQHYLFSVQAFAKTILLSPGGDEYDYALRDRTLKARHCRRRKAAKARSACIVRGHALDRRPRSKLRFAEAGLEFHALIGVCPQEWHFPRQATRW